LPIEEARNIQEEISYWAAKALLDRNPAGFDASETLDCVFGKDALERKSSNNNRQTRGLGTKHLDRFGVFVL